MTIFLLFLRKTWWIWLLGIVLFGLWRWHENAINARIYKEVYIQVYAIRLQEEADKIKLAKELADLKAKSEVVTEHVVTQYVDRVKVVHEKAKTIIEKVNVYVPVESDNRCVVNRGFVSMWNDSNQGSVPGTATEAHGEASEVRLSEIGTQHAREAELCRATETQLESLQDWVSEQQKLRSE